MTSHAYVPFAVYPVIPDVRPCFAVPIFYLFDEPKKQNFWVQVPDDNGIIRRFCKPDLPVQENLVNLSQRDDKSLMRYEGDPTLFAFVDKRETIHIGLTTSLDDRLNELSKNFTTSAFFRLEAGGFLCSPSTLYQAISDGARALERRGNSNTWRVMETQHQVRVFAKNIGTSSQALPRKNSKPDKIAHRAKELYLTILQTGPSGHVTAEFRELLGVLAHRDPSNKFLPRMLEAIKRDATVEEPVAPIDLKAPNTMAEAEEIAKLGNIAIPVLKWQETGRSARQRAACVRALRLIDTPMSREALELYLNDTTLTVANELLKSKSPWKIPGLLKSYQLSENIPLPLSYYIRYLDGIADYWQSESLNLAPCRVHDLSPLSRVKNLRKLIISSPGISNLDPLSRLESLEELDISFGHVTDFHPLSELPNLRSLTIRNAWLEDLRPFSNLQNLESLSFTGWGYYGPDLSPLSTLRKLKNFQIKNLMVAGPFASSLAPLSALINLQSLILKDYCIEDLAPLRALTQLRSLSISDNSVIDISPLSDLPQLQNLELHSRTVRDISAISKIKNLKSISLELRKNCNLQPIEFLENLESIHIGNQNFDNLDVLTNLLSLKSLSISNSEIQNFENISKIKNLEILKIYHTKIDNILPFGELNNLKSIDISHTNTNDLKPLTKLKKLQSIRLYETPAAQASSKDQIKSMFEQDIEVYM